ncbi:MAG: hypothetical protein Q7S33_05355 [Nanoarchaeota archaeon]|nr:hypothetical protein [Nanoarchaeota archaeon]
MNEKKVSNLVKALEDVGIELGEPIECQINPEHTKAVTEFLRKIEDAHKRTRNSTIKFDNYSNNSSYYCTSSLY